MQFLALQLQYHSQTRTLHDLIALLCTTHSAIHDDAPLNPDPTLSFHQRQMRGPLSDQAYLTSLGKAVSLYLTPSQVLPSAALFVKALKSCYDLHAHNQNTPPSEGGGKELQAAQFASLARFGDVLLLAFPSSTISPETALLVEGQLEELRRDVLHPAIDVVLSTPHLSYGNSLVAAASLRMWYSLQRVPYWRSKEVGVDELRIQGEGFKRLLEESHLLPELKVELVRCSTQLYWTTLINLVFF